MAKRLRLAKRLLSEKGVIFISIDDNEQAQLKMLCDKVFGDTNFVSNVIWQHSLQAKGYTGKISLHHNYTCIYKKSDSFTLGLLDRTEEHNVSYSNPDNDLRGLWRSGDVRNALVRKNLMYNILTPSGKIINHPPKGWRFSSDTFQKELGEGKIIFSKDETRIIRKIYLDDQDGRVPESIWFGKETGTTRDGTQILKDIFGESMAFDSPKPIQLLNRILQIGGNKTSKILDFFAGSGTTLHATMQLNAEDGGNRQCILVTNNENNICEEVTYERNRRVIQGYTNSKGDWVAGIANNNLRYYKMEFVVSAKTEVNRRRLTQLSTELLQIKEDCYTDITEAEGFDRKRCSIHTNQLGKYLIVVYYSRTQIEVTEQLCAWIASRPDLTEKIKVYGFSSEPEVLTDDFYDVADRISAVPLPDAIYNAYRATFRTLKLDQKPLVQTLPTTSQTEAN
jgi:adenine-specific DNA-methyltransferase